MIVGDRLAGGRSSSAAASVKTHPRGCNAHCLLS